MKGHDTIINHLNKLLTGELTAADQYFVHSRMYEDWGMKDLYERIKHEMEEELEHASWLIERILFLEGTPDVSKRDKLNIGKDVPSMLKSDLALEYEVADHLKEAMASAEEKRDYVTRDILLKMLDDTEMDHAYWLEKQLGLIDKMGLENYIQSKS